MRKTERETSELVFTRARFYSALELSGVALLLVLCVWKAQGAEPASAPAREQSGQDLSPAVQRAREARRARRRAVEVLGERLEPGAVDGLLSSLQDEDPYVRGAAAERLGRSRDPRALAALTGALASPVANARWGAIDGLAELGDRRAVPALLPLLGHADQATRWKAAIALGRLRDRRAVAALTRALDDPYDQVSYAAADALGTIRDRAAEAALRAKEGSRDAAMKGRAAAARRRLGER
ncbi:MAG: HEAT repeat domain-containing protein [Elusimicrobia bacterium]|nr:HEAT repeat domain-containing protein [Elusimicrobiota bacterium]